MESKAPLGNPRLDLLTDFAFRRLASLLEGVAPPAGLDPIDMSIGEPRDAPPALLTETLAAHGHLWGRYPPANGTPAFRRAACAWLTRRYRLPADMLDPDRHLLPLAGTKEGLFLAAQTIVDASARASAGAGAGRPALLMPNPVYNVYVGAAVMAGAEPVLLPAERATGFLPDLDALSPELLARTAAFYLCTPSNPQGGVADLGYLREALALARRHGFVLVLDECYAEIWDRAAPPGGLEIAAETGSLDNLLAFHSLSKRSSAAGLRSGFAVGDPGLIRLFYRLRSYGAAVQPLPVLATACALWGDEAHVEANRALYREKLDRAQQILGDRFGFYRPQGGFFLWLDVEDGEAAARRLWAQAALRTLPGGYLGQTGPDGHNPGSRYIRLALVDDPATVSRALERLVDVLDQGAG